MLYQNINLNKDAVLEITNKVITDETHMSANLFHLVSAIIHN